MPRQATIQRNKRYDAPVERKTPQVDVQQQYLYIDNFRPGPRSQVANQFASALETITSGLAKAESGLFKDIKEEKERKGTIAGLLGIEIDAVPDEPKDPAIAARQKMRGKVATAEFKSALDAFFTENKDADPAAYQSKLENLKREFLVGKDRSFIEGFLPDALHYEQQANETFIKYRDAKDTEDFLNEIGGMAHAELVNLMSKDTFDAETVAEYLHEFTINAQELGKAYKGLSRNQINEKILDTIGIIAVREGRPDLLDFVLRKDKDGVAVWDTNLKEDAARYIQGAETQRDAILKEQERIEKERIAEAKESIQRQMYAALHSGNPSATAQAHEMLVNNAELFPPSTFNALLEDFTELRSADGTYFAKESDEDVLVNLSIAAEDNKLSLDTLRKYKPALSRSDYIKLSGKMINAEQKARKEAQAGKDDDNMEDYFNEQKTSFKQEILLSGDFMEKDNPFGDDTTRQRQRFAMFYLTDEWKKIKEQRAKENKPVTPEDVLWVYDMAKYKAYRKVPITRGGKVIFDKMDEVAPNPGNPGSGRPKPSASKKSTSSTTGGKPSFDDL